MGLEIKKSVLESTVFVGENFWRWKVNRDMPVVIWIKRIKVLLRDGSNKSTLPISGGGH